MRRRLVAVAVVALGLAAAPAAAQALPGRAVSNGYWGCVGTYHIDFGVCVENPLPEQLPRVEVPPPPPA